MIENRASPIRLHEDPELFREAVNYTAATTGFIARLIEKDYFCSVVLQHLATVSNLVFRGGTCLSKVHAELYRLSEDLDFIIPTPVDLPRSERSRSASGAKVAVETAGADLPGLSVVTSVTGSNESRQYNGVVGYHSVFGSRKETIRIEVSLREPLCESPIEGGLRTLLLNPVSGSALTPTISFTCLSWREAVAEKFRAALSRREIAIRDFYDIDHAVRGLGLDLLDPELVSLVERKLAVPGNDSVDVSTNRLAMLRLQVESQLKPVLRPRDFEEFDLQRASNLATAMVAAMGQTS